MKAILSLLVFSALLMAGKAPAQGGIGVDRYVTYRSYKSGSTSRIAKEKKVVITSQDQFQQYWKESTGRDGREAPTDVDFRTEQLVAFHLGHRPTTGYTVIIKSVDRVNPGTVKVTARETRPSPESMQAQHVTSPFVIIRMPRLPVDFTFALEQVDAPGQIFVPAPFPIDPTYPPACNCACGCSQTGICNCGRN